MKKSLKDSIVLVISIIIVLSLLIVGVIAYIKDSSDQDKADSVVSSALQKLNDSVRSKEEVEADLRLAMSNLQIEVIKLDYLKAETGIQYTPEKAMTDSIILASDALNKVKTLTSEVDSLKETTTVQVNAKIKQIEVILADWSLLSSSNNYSSQAGIINKAKECAEQIDNIIEELEQIINSLDNKISSSDMEELREIVDTAKENTKNAIAIIEITINPVVPSSGSNSVIQEQIQEQQNIVNQTVLEVNYLEDQLGEGTNNNNTNPDNTGTNINANIPSDSVYVLPPVKKVDTLGKPQLIEGANPIDL